MKALARRAIGRAAGSHAATGAARLLARLERRRPHQGSLAIITYHRIATPDERPDLLDSLRSTDPDGFVAQIDLLAEHHHFVSVDEVLEWRRTGEPAPPRAVLVTFDDAYADLAEHAWPALRARGIPAVAFVPTGFVDSGRAFWWDAVHEAVRRTDRPSLPWRGGVLPTADAEHRAAAMRRLRVEVKSLPHHDAMAEVEALIEASGVEPEPAPVLGWDRLRQLHDEGLVLAPHTRSHAFLDRLTVGEARAEVEGSIADLEAHLGSCPPVFAYPSGQWDDGARRAVEAAGIEVAMTTTRGVNAVPGADWLTLDRINVGGRTTPPLLQAQLLQTTGGLVRRLNA